MIVYNLRMCVVYEPKASQFWYPFWSILATHLRGKRNTHTAVNYSLPAASLWVGKQPSWSPDSGIGWTVSDSKGTHCRVSFTLKDSTSVAWAPLPLPCAHHRTKHVSWVGVGWPVLVKQVFGATIYMLCVENLRGKCCSCPCCMQGELRQRLFKWLTKEHSQ